MYPPPQHRAVNSWVQDSGSGGGGGMSDSSSGSSARSLLQTASKLGRRILSKGEDATARPRERRMSRDKY